MKLLERNDARLVFSLGSREKTFLERLLAFFPLEPQAHPLLSRDADPSLADAETLLHESLRDRKKELAAWIQRRFSEGALTRAGSSWRLALEPADQESLLQVLNELRVSAWIRLGRPDELNEASWANNAASASLHAIMTLAGQFEMVLLAALHGGIGTDTTEA